MARNIFGKVLEVDLSSGKITQTAVDPEFGRLFVGGQGFSNKILYDEVGPQVDALSPENIIIFAPGTFVGTHIPTAARTEITTKNPLTGSIGTGNTGGMWGAALKRAGFEMLIVRNKADRPVYLQIDNDRVEIKEAVDLWGKDIYEAAGILEQRTSARFSILAIGQAGENLVSYACPINDYHHGANRNGAGAVMGSKNLKAVIVRGSGLLEPARPDELARAVQVLKERMQASRDAMNKPGSYSGGRDAVKRYLEEGGLRVKNYQAGFLPNFLETRGRELAAKYVTRREGCYGCPTPCFDIGEVKEGKYAGTLVGRPTFAGIACAWGANCAIDNLPAIWKCKELTHRYGMDYVSASGVVAFAMELYQRGIITTADTGGLELTWGNEDATIELLRQISYRQGFGAVLAEGTARAAGTIGRGAEKYVMTLKNVEVMCGDPRAHQKLYVLCDMTNPRGGDNIKGGHNAVDPDKYDPNWWTDQFDMFPEMKEKIFRSPPREITSTWEGKAWMCKWTQDLYQLLNSLGICFPLGGRLLLGPDSLSNLYSAYTGWDTSPRSIMESGERVFNLFKAYCVRQGQNRKDDNWPDRFYNEPLADGPKKGQTLSRSTMEKVLDDYYEARGWDKKSGTPTREKLNALGLADVAEDLAKRGRLP
jgi:aldehyde:ferredoxin oxidoreductase